jgi:hypothetical protein
MKTLPIILVLVVLVFIVFMTRSKGKAPAVQDSCPPGYYSRPGSTWGGGSFECLPIGTDAMEPGLPMNSMTRFGTMYGPIVAGTRLTGVGSNPERASKREFPVQKDLTLFPGY